MKNNPFDFMQSFMNQDNLMNSMKNMPNMDPSSFNAMLKSNADVITATNQMLSESIQSVLKRNTDSLQKNTTEMFNSMKDAISAGDAEQINSCQQKYLKSTLENNINNTKEILDITTKSSIEILDTIGKNMGENLGKNFAKNGKNPK
jgi:phasin family protein